MDLEGIIIVAIVFGTPLAGLTLYGIYKLLKMWIGGPSGDAVPREDFNRLGKAFVTFKKDAESRIQNLEAIVADEESPSEKETGGASQGSRQLGEPTRTIEVDSEDREKGESRQQKKSSSDSSNLRNMLRE